MLSKPNISKKWRCHRPISVGAHTGIVYICLSNKNCVTKPSYSGKVS